ncbi:PREDICTED: 60S ribosomal protein L36-like [Condylura cristata]|uniref:60S ribosomal protein L36-like n=1 Tax=Condylura cristata TaxID=143302 RepID=UPI0006438020|nr:PREDICTED: 60S ribosomal protein L36-like [Condylura cristata]
MSLHYPMAVDTNRGHKVTSHMSKPSTAYHGKPKFIWDMVHEICSFAPCEQHAMSCSYLKGQVDTPVLQEKGGDTHLLQEEERGAKQGLGTTKSATKKN